MQNQGNQAETSGIAPHVADILSFYDNITIPIKVIGNEPLIENLKTSLDVNFSVKDFGPIHYYLGIEFLRNKDGLALTQRKSSTEAEYRAPADSTCKVTWIQCLLKEFQINVPTSIPIICDNASSIALASNHVHHARRMIATPEEPDLPVPVSESFHEQTDKELTHIDIKRMDIHNQAIQTILLGLPEDVYAAVDSCETTKEIWERVRKMIKGSDIGEQEKKAKLFNEWEWFTSTDGESIESYYHRFMQLMNDVKRNKHFLKNIASNLKFLNNLQPEWKRHITDPSFSLLFILRTNT
nr:copia protein [Tanacetum cinerariifolium]